MYETAAVLWFSCACTASGILIERNRWFNGFISGALFGLAVAATVVALTPP